MFSRTPIQCWSVKSVYILWYFLFLCPTCFCLFQAARETIYFSQNYGNISFEWMHEMILIHAMHFICNLLMRLSITLTHLCKLCFFLSIVFQRHKTRKYEQMLLIKESTFIKNRHFFFIQDRFDKLISSINTIIKCILQPVKFQLVCRFWTGSKMKWLFIVSLN